MEFEKISETYGVKVDSHLADNGRSSKLGFCEAVAIANQTITLCGIGTHHHNGIIERYIQDITGIGRTLLLHIKQHWPDMTGTLLCPFALKAAEDRRNHLKLD